MSTKKTIYLTIHGKEFGVVFDSLESMNKCLGDRDYDCHYVEAEIDISKPKLLEKHPKPGREARKIITDNPCPPIPARNFDWSAVYDDYDGAAESHCPIGHGETELAAINDLISQEAP